MMYDETIYDEAERYLKKALAKWRQHLPELWEDAYQEGMIQVWRDVEADVQPKLKLLRRAALAAEKYIHRNGEYSFGKPKKSREGISRNTVSREKIETFLEEYLPVHDWVYPSSKVIADATGLNPSNVANHLKNIREGRGDHMVYREDGRMDWDYYKSMSVELLSVQGESDSFARGGTPGSNRHWTDSAQVSHLQDSFEDDLASSIDLVDVLNQLADGPREILYLYLFEGYSPTDIARSQGKETNANSKGTRTLNAALSQVRMLIAPYEGECTEGHKRSPETSLVKRRSDGYYTRLCTVCRKEAGGPKIAKKPGKRMGRPPTTKCPKGHTKDKVDSQGRLRCSQCRAEAQRAYTKRKREGK